MKKNYYNVNQIDVHKFIYFLAIASFIIIIFNTYNFVLERSPNQYSDWLINYQGGFVRRGLAGEFLFQLHKFSNIPLDSLVLVFITLLYSIFYFYFFKLIKIIKFNFINLLVFLSPLSFLYPVMEQKISGRKDILFLASIFLVLNFLKNFDFKKQKYFLFIIFIITILTHSGFIFYTPYLITIFVLYNIKKDYKELFSELIWIGVFLFLILLLILKYSSITPESIVMICKSIEGFLPNCGKQDYIASLSWSLTYEKNLVSTLWTRDGYQYFYILAFILTFAPLAYLLNSSKFIYKKIKKISPLFIFSFLILFTLPVYFIGADFGRYMFWSYLSTIIIFFFFAKNKVIKVDYKNKKLDFIMIVVIFLYCFTWTIPHCCSNNFKFIYKKPVQNIIEIVN